MNRPILNASFQMPADGWFHALAIGEFPNVLHVPDPAAPDKPRRVPVMQICDRRACEALVTAFNRAAAAPNFTGLLIDRDHESSDPERTTDAWGWCVGMQNREDGVWCQIRWTDIGEPAVKGGRFRFLSPVFAPEECENLGNNRLRPLAMTKLGLTNEPNIRPLHPLSNRSPGGAAAPADSGTTKPHTGERRSGMDHKKELLTLLGLKEDATEQDICNACSAAKQKLANCATLTQERDQLKNRAETAETELNTLRKAELDRAVEGDLEEFKAVIVNREEAKAQLLANREGARKLLAALKPAAPAEPLRNRQDAKPPEDPAAAQRLENRRQERDAFVAQLKAGQPEMSNAVAWSRAATLKPELFRE
jgi:phage I-like protein